VRQLNSLRSKLIIYIALAAILITSVALVLGYYTTRRQLYHQLEARAGALTDQIGYAFEVLIDSDDMFPIQRIIEQTAALEDVFAVAVVDRFGEIMAHNNKSKLGQPLIDPLIPLAIDQEQRVSEFTSNRFVIVDPLTSRNYSLVYHSDVIGAVWIEMDLSTLTAQLRRQYTLLVAVMVGLVSLLSLAALVMLQRLIVNRLHHLQGGLKQVEAGDLSYRLTDVSRHGHGDEIAGLVLSFNQMTAALQTRTEQRQKAETSRQASEARMTAMLDTAADAIFTVDAHQKIVTFNRGAEEIFGYQSAEIVGQPLEILIPPNVRQKHHRHVEKFAASVVAYHSMRDRSEIEACHKDGRIFPAEATLAKLEQDGEISFTVILRDITDRKNAEDALRQSEENFRTFFDAVDDYLFILDEEGNIQYFNAAVTNRLGYTPATLLGQHILTVHPPERRDEAGQIVAAMLQTFGASLQRS
jgi:PAS domain S-box-containing protein